MPKTFYTEEGEEVQNLYEETEVQTLKEQAEKAKKVEELELELEEIRSKPETVNWKAAREKEKRLMNILKEKGVEIDEKTGEPIVNVDPSYVATKAEQIANRKFMDALIEDAIDGFTEKKEEVKEVFDALTFGKQIDRKNYREFIEKAARAVGINEEEQGNLVRRLAFSQGGQPPDNTNRQTFDETQEGQGVGSLMGLKSFQEQNK